MPVRQEHVQPLLHRYVAGSVKGSEPQPIEFDRALLLAEVELPGGRG
jgi:hypothetical protein